MSHQVKRRIINILFVQHKICEDAKHDISKYTIKHSYCSSTIFNVPSEWINVDHLSEIPEFIGTDKNEVIKEIECLEKNGEINLVSRDGILYISYKKG